MILVVDDDEDVRATVRETLDILSYESAEAGDGPTALAMIKTRRPSVVILDYLLPGMNGDEVATRINQDHGALPLIFVTGCIAEPDLRLRVGNDVPILCKPFKMADLALLVHDALK